jgi:hypothetical protein
MIEELNMNHKLKFISAVTATLFSINSFATTQTLTGSFTTVQSVSILPTATTLEINGLQLTAADECVLAHTTSGNSYLGDVIMRLGNTGTTNSAGSATATTTSGGGCVTSTLAGGTIGLYEITGAPGSLVTVTVTDSDGFDIELAPAGCVGDYAASGVDGDECEPLDGSTFPTIRLADSSDTGSLGEGTPVAGTTLVALGGTATVASGATLTAGTAYPIDFQIDVTY